MFVYVTRPVIPVLLHLREERDEEVAAREDADAAARDVLALPGDVAREAETRLEVVRVDLAAVEAEVRLVEVRIVAVRVESYRTPRLTERFDIGRQSSWTNAAMRVVFALTSAEPTP